MKKRTLSREFAVQMMYQAEIMLDPSEFPVNKPGEITGTFWKSIETNIAGEIKTFAEELFTNAFIRRQEHDRMIAQFLKESWSIERLGEMEKCILRVSIDELLNTDTPAYAILDDYVTLTKKFTDEKTASFVNGLLDKIKNTFVAEKAGKVKK